MLGRKGSAWDKPSINSEHKANMQAVARSAANSAGHAHDKELQDILAHLEGLSSDRKTHARKEIIAALAAARRGEDPTKASLFAPCKPCVGWSPCRRHLQRRRRGHVTRECAHARGF